MKTFREFVLGKDQWVNDSLKYRYLEEFDRDDIKNKVLDAIHAQDSPTIEDTSLNSFEDKDRILTYPGLQVIISQGDKQGVVQELLNSADEDENITIGNLINILTSSEEVPEEAPTVPITQEI